MEVAFRREGEILCADFKVSHSPLCVNPNWSTSESIWGLWEKDVVEVFVRGDRQSRYFEFQVSPLGQYFELEIFEPRVRTNRSYVSGANFSAAVKEGNGWSASLRIPLKSIMWTGEDEQLVGNAFACLGPVEKRTYWSLFLPEQKKPDFHLPKYFRPLLGDRT